MASGSFEKTSVGWQLQQAMQRASEWIELQLSQAPELPAPSVEPWFIETIFWIVVGCLAIGIGWQLYRLLQAYLTATRPYASTTREPQPLSQQNWTVAGWLRQAQDLQRQGNYAGACRALYMAMLQRLNDTERLPHQTSRTDGEYLHLVAAFPRPHPYQMLIRTHERLCFGNAQISEDIFQRCQQAYKEIETEVEAK